MSSSSSSKKNNIRRQIVDTCVLKISVPADVGSSASRTHQESLRAPRIEHSCGSNSNVRPNIQEMLDDLIFTLIKDKQWDAARTAARKCDLYLELGTEYYLEHIDHHELWD